MTIAVDFTRREDRTDRSGAMRERGWRGRAMAIAAAVSVPDPVIANGTLYATGLQNEPSLSGKRVTAFRLPAG